MGFRWTNIFAGRRHPTPALIGPCLLPAERWVPSTVAGGAAYGAALPPHASASESPRPRRGYLVAFPALRKLGPPGTWIRRRVGPAWLWHDRLGGQSWHWWLTRATSSAVTAGDPVGLRRPGRRRRWWRDSKHPGRGVAAEAADGAPGVARPGRIVRCTVRHWNGPPRGGGGGGRIVSSLCSTAASAGLSHATVASSLECAVCLYEEKQPLLQHWISSRVNNVL